MPDAYTDNALLYAVVGLFSFYFVLILFVVSLIPVRCFEYFAIGSPRVGYGLDIFNVSSVAFPKQVGIKPSGYAFYLRVSKYYVLGTVWATESPAGVPVPSTYSD